MIVFVRGFSLLLRVEVDLAELHNHLDCYALLDLSGQRRLDAGERWALRGWRPRQRLGHAYIVPNSRNESWLRWHKYLERRGRGLTHWLTHRRHGNTEWESA